MTFKNGLCRGQEHLLARRGCLGNDQRVAATGRLDYTGHRGYARNSFGDPEFRIRNQPDLRAAIFRHSGSGQLATGVGVFQLDVSQSRQQCLPAVLQR